MDSAKQTLHRSCVSRESWRETPRNLYHYDTCWTCRHGQHSLPQDFVALIVCLMLKVVDGCPEDFGKFVSEITCGVFGFRMSSVGHGYSNPDKHGENSLGEHKDSAMAIVSEEKASTHTSLSSVKESDVIDIGSDSGKPGGGDAHPLLEHKDSTTSNGTNRSISEDVSQHTDSKSLPGSDVSVSESKSVEHEHRESELANGSQHSFGGGKSEHVDFGNASDFNANALDDDGEVLNFPVGHSEINHYRRLPSVCSVVLERFCRIDVSRFVSFVSFIFLIVLFCILLPCCLCANELMNWSVACSAQERCKTSTVV